MNKYLFFLIMFACLDTHVFSNEQNKKSSKELIYHNLLSRYNCIIGPNINNPQWICNLDAPNGWAQFYGEKLKKIKKNRKRYAIN